MKHRSGKWIHYLARTAEISGKGSAGEAEQIEERYEAQIVYCGCKCNSVTGAKHQLYCLRCKHKHYKTAYAAKQGKQCKTAPETFFNTFLLTCTIVLGSEYGCGC